MGRGRTAQSTEHREPRPDYNQLVVFLKVVESRSFSGAAKALNRTQPAISQAIMRLEEVCGADLFQRRRGAPLILSPVGEAIVGSARKVIEVLDRQMADASRAARGERGMVTLGFSGSLSASPLRWGITEFARHCADVDLKLVEGEPGEFDRQLLDGTIDLAIAPQTPNFLGTSVCRETLWEERLWAVLPASHEQAHRLSIGWADFATTTIILGNYHGDPAALYRYAGAAGVGLDVRLHRISRAALLDVIGCGIGVTIVAQSEITARSDVVFRPIQEADATMIFEAIWLREDAKPLRHRLLNAIRANIKAGQYPVSSDQLSASDQDRG